MLFAFPAQAKVGRVVAKSKIYQHTTVSKALRERFVTQVDQILWQYKLAPETVNLPATPAVPEIQVFDIALKSPDLDEDVLRAIDRAIPLPIVFQLHHGERVRMIAACKKPVINAKGKGSIERYYAGDWLRMDAARQPLPVALDLLGLYGQLLRSLLPYPARIGESLADHLERMGELRDRQGERSMLKARLQRERQFNRKVVLNAELRALDVEIARLRN